MSTKSLNKNTTALIYPVLINKTSELYFNGKRKPDARKTLEDIDWLLKLDTQSFQARLYTLYLIYTKIDF